MRKRILALILCMAMLAVTATGCQSRTEESKGDSGKETTAQENAEADYADTLFDTEVVHTINVEISEEDWADLKENPLEKTKYEVNVTIDGESMESVSFATKGNTSLSQVASSDSDRYSFKLNFGKFVDGQTYHGLDKLNLNNIMSDATYMKDYLSYAIMREAGVAAPLTSYVQLSINGEVFGLYLAVEEIDDSFLERNYGDSDGALYKPETEQLADAGNMGDRGNMQRPEGMERPDGTQQSDGTEQSDGTQPPEGGELPDGTQPPEGGELPDGTQRPEGMEKPEGMGQNGMQMWGDMDNAGADLKYIDDNTESYSAIFDNTVNDVTDEDNQAVIAALKQLADGENLEHNWDMEAVIKYFVAHNFILNYDSYTGNMLHNYYLFEEDGVLSILPWDYNLAFGGFSARGEATEVINQAIDTPLSGTTEEDRPLWSVIADNEEYLELYHQYFSELLTKYFESGECAAEIDRVSALIRDYVKNDPTAFYTVDEFDTAVSTLKDFCSLRAESVRGQLDGTIPSTTEEQQKDTSVLVKADELNISAMGNQGGSGRDHMREDQTRSEEKK